LEGLIFIVAVTFLTTLVAVVNSVISELVFQSIKTALVLPGAVTVPALSSTDHVYVHPALFVTENPSPVLQAQVDVLPVIIEAFGLIFTVTCLHPFAHVVVPQVGEPVGVTITA
jgi:hypothetical protein